MSLFDFSLSLSLMIKLPLIESPCRVVVKQLIVVCNHSSLALCYLLRERCVALPLLHDESLMRRLLMIKDYVISRRLIYRVTARYHVMLR